MGNKALIYQKKVQDNLRESYKHLIRIDEAFEQLHKKYSQPINEESYESILNSIQDMAYSDQIIYRFSKLQDVMGAKLFKSLLLSQGENTDKPFLDILNQLEKMNIVNVEEWFEIRDLRNEIAHDYDAKESVAIEIINSIYELKSELKDILDSIKNIVILSLLKK
jgi:uncharacterized protein with HEPN domain